MIAVDSVKENGVVYTPQPIVETMLNSDVCPDMAGKRILDPACGNGQFLVEIVKQVCERLLKNELAIYDAKKEKQKEFLKEEKRQLVSTLQGLTGFDIDKEALEECKERLDNVMKGYGHEPHPWGLFHMDCLKDLDEFKSMPKFDIVIGNPPYVRIQNLSDERKKALQSKNFELISGCSDLYILFFEIGFYFLKHRGQLIYITPNSYFKTKAGRELRKHIRRHYKIDFLCDFKHVQVFEGKSTYTAIVSLNNSAPDFGEPKGDFRQCISLDEKGYPVMEEDCQLVEHATGWSLLSRKEKSVLTESNGESPVRLGDVADINVGIQTLADSVFIFPIDEHPEFNSEILRPILKASTMRKGKNKEQLVLLYPYYNGKLIPEKQIRALYPKEYEYLLSHKERLLGRDKGKGDPEKWYGFGRSVGLTSFQVKLVTPSMSDKPRFDKIDTLFYSGYSVTPKKGKGINIDELAKELNSKRMEGYIKTVSKPFRNGWFSYSKQYLQEYPLHSNVNLYAN